MIKSHLLPVIVLLASFCMACSSQAVAYDALVAADGTGQYTSVQAAIDAAPTHRTTPYIIYVRSGNYDEQLVIPADKPHLHLVGEGRNTTRIYHRLNLGGSASDRGWNCSVHNPASPVYKCEGSVVFVLGKYFYAQDITFENSYGTSEQNGPQALAMKVKADASAFYHCNFRSFQDTWQTSSRDSDRTYARDCYIEGAVDYIFGGGDALFENCSLYNVRSGSVIVAPCQTAARFGYVFRNCTVDGNQAASDGRQLLGRPWHNAPVAVYIHTTFRIPVAPNGWTDMGTVPKLFAEYDSRDTNCNLLDLSARKTHYEAKEKSGDCPTTLTADEAAHYVYETMMTGTDGWNPKQYMK
jgi:pectinesterase